MFIINPLSPVACLGHLKRGAHPPGKQLVILMIRDLCQFLPPTGCQDMSGAPLIPLPMLQGRGLWILGSHGDGIPSPASTLAGDSSSHLGVPGVGGNSRSSPSMGMVPTSPIGCNQLVLLLASPQSSISVGVVSRPCPPWHCVLSSPPLVRVPSPQQRSPVTSV